MPQPIKPRQCRFCIYHEKGTPGRVVIKDNASVDYGECQTCGFRYTPDEVKGLRRDDR